MEVTGIYFIVVDVTLLGWRDRDFLRIADTGFFKNALKMIFLQSRREGGGKRLVKGASNASCRCPTPGELDNICRYHVHEHVISECRIGGKNYTHFFFSMLDTSCNLNIGSKSFVLGRIDLILSEHGKSGFHTQLFDSDLARRHVGGLDKVGVKPAENPQKKKSIKS